MNTEIIMFGETVEDMVAAKPSLVDNLLYATMILSDAQEVLVRGETKKARQFINKAKFFITEERKRR